jgi:hypothetical protein
MDDDFILDGALGSIRPLRRCDDCQHLTFSLSVCSLCWNERFNEMFGTLRNDVRTGALSDWGPFHHAMMLCESTVSEVARQCGAYMGWSVAVDLIMARAEMFGF